MTPELKPSFPTTVSAVKAVQLSAQIFAIIHDTNAKAGNFSNEQLVTALLEKSFNENTPDKAIEECALGIDERLANIGCNLSRRVVFFQVEQILTRHFGSTRKEGGDDKCDTTLTAAVHPANLAESTQSSPVSSPAPKANQQVGANCPHCGSEKGAWFDRSLTINSSGDEVMPNRCLSCGKDVEDLGESAGSTETLAAPPSVSADSPHSKGASPSRSAEEWHHTQKYVQAQKAINQYWQCHCVSCEHVRQIQSSSHLDGRIEQAKIDIEQVRSHWNNNQLMTNQKWQAEQSANVLQSLLTELEKQRTT